MTNGDPLGESQPRTAVRGNPAFDMLLFSPQPLSFICLSNKVRVSSGENACLPAREGDRNDLREGHPEKSEQ